MVADVADRQSPGVMPRRFGDIASGSIPRVVPASRNELSVRGGSREERRERPVG